MLSIFIYVLYVISCICIGMKCDEFLYILKNFWNFIEVVFMFKILFSIFIYFMVRLYKKKNCVMFYDYFNYRV